MLIKTAYDSQIASLAKNTYFRNNDNYNACHVGPCLSRHTHHKSQV